PYTTLFRSPNHADSESPSRRLLQLALEEHAGAAEERDLILLARQRVALVLGHHVLDGHLSRPKRLNDLVRLGTRDARVVGAGVDEQRSLDLVDLLDRRDRLQKRPVLLEVAELDLEDLADHAAGRLEKRRHVRDAEEIHARLPEARPALEGDQDGVGAGASAGKGRGGPGRPGVGPRPA